MNKNELIQALSNVSFASAPVIATMDMGLQYEYIMPDGAGVGLGGMGAWPAYKMRKIEQSKWNEIRSKIFMNALKEEDFKDTDFQYLFENAHAIYGAEFDNFYGMLSSVFSNFLDMPEETPETIYCLWDLGSWGDYPAFFIEEEDLFDDFEARYCGELRSWEDMDSDELQEWYEKSQEYLSEFTYIFYGDE